jgi:hypothetical protein
MSEHKYPMQTLLLLAIMVYLVAAFQQPSIGIADVIVPVTIQTSPTHFERFDDDEDDVFTVVTDLWFLDSVEFPSLEGAGGEIALQVRTPNGERLVVEQYPESAYQIQFGSTLDWRKPGTVGGSPANTLELEPSFSFIGESGVPPSSFRTIEAKLSAVNGSLPPDMESLAASINSLNAPGDWGFEGFDLSIPVSDVLDHFNDTPALQPYSFAIAFEYLVPGNAVGTADADQFTLLVPEPTSMTTTFLLFCVLSLLSRATSRRS